jgi:hypothetical protein
MVAHSLRIVPHHHPLALSESHWAVQLLSAPRFDNESDARLRPRFYFRCPGKFCLQRAGRELGWPVKDLKKEEAEGKPSPAKLEKIRGRAGELAMNHGKRAHQADEKETRRAERELLDLEITSPKFVRGRKRP